MDILIVDIVMVGGFVHFPLPVTRVPIGFGNYRIEPIGIGFGSVKIIDLPNRFTENIKDVLPIISATNDGRRTRLPPFEPSRCDESNGGGFVLLSPLDAEIIGETSKNQAIL